MKRIIVGGLIAVLSIAFTADTAEARGCRSRGRNVASGCSGQTASACGSQSGGCATAQSQGAGCNSFASATGSNTGYAQGSGYAIQQDGQPYGTAYSGQPLQMPNATPQGQAIPATYNQTNPTTQLPTTERTESSFPANPKPGQIWTVDKNGRWKRMTELENKGTN